MQDHWKIDFEDERYDLNIANYSSLFVNYTSNETNLINVLNDYLQPRSKVKDVMHIKDVGNDYEEINHHQVVAFKLSNDLLLAEISLGAKSYTKNQIKHDLLNNIETDGYLNTINTLIEDLVEQALLEYPIRSKDFTIDTFMKMLEIDMGLVNNQGVTNNFLHQNKILLPIVKKHLEIVTKGRKIIFYMYPESYLSPKEQMELKNLLIEYSEEIPVFVVTKSPVFISTSLHGLNYFIKDKQLFTKDLIEEMEWESPLGYDSSSIEESIQFIFNKFANQFELNPIISNYKNTDIVLFKSIDLFVIVYLFMKIGFSFQLDIDEEKVDKPVYEYLLDCYE
ncbi:hypothetical protein, partial [Halalkalibacillus halophilus]|uniref:hypothetical protein n=1 Tax=Halalkalibacillus halophilus TaxID=392827 RepID=UPI0004838648